jgi:hypothetical protein
MNLIGICSHQFDYRLVWEINNLLGIQLSKGEGFFEVSHKKAHITSLHNYYEMQDEDNFLSIYLVKNKGDKKLLIPEKSQIDYFLFILKNQNFKCTDLIQKLKSSKIILASLLLNPTDYPSTEEIIFLKKMKMNKKTKIVATLGPACSSKEVLKEMILQGVNVCRLNFSHGSYEDHASLINIIRELNKETGLNVAILADLQGPKIRVHEVENNGIFLENGKVIKIITERILGTAEKISINYEKLPRDVKSGEKILLDDGKIELKVISSDGIEILAEIIHGGNLSSKKVLTYQILKFRCLHLLKKT